jgi:hypothetical protein
MKTPPTEFGAALRRMLSNGPLTGWPRRPADQEILVALTAARFERGRAYAEVEVNEVLKDWLATFSAPFGIDHVSMRRALVDAGFLQRDTAGAWYWIEAAKAPKLDASPDPAGILAEIEAERAERKRRAKGA